MIPALKELASRTNVVLFGSKVHQMRRRRTAQEDELKTLSVRIERTDYERLCHLSETHKPKMTKNYLIQLAIHRLLQLADNNQLELSLSVTTQE